MPETGQVQQFHPGRAPWAQIRAYMGFISVSPILDILHPSSLHVRLPDPLRSSMMHTCETCLESHGQVPIPGGWPSRQITPTDQQFFFHEITQSWFTKMVLIYWLGVTLLRLRRSSVFWESDLHPSVWVTCVSLLLLSNNMFLRFSYICIWISSLFFLWMNSIPLCEFSTTCLLFIYDVPFNGFLLLATIY